MSVHFSRFALNTYSGTPYFRAHVSEDYPLSLVLQKSRAFRRLPENLRELSEKAKAWAAKHDAALPGVEDYYDDDGNELDPSSGHPLTDEEIDEQWSEDESLTKFEVKDIPVPDGGFPDPDTWELPEQEEDEPNDRVEKYLLKQIKEHGRRRVARSEGISDEQLEGIESDEDLVKTIIGAGAA